MSKVKITIEEEGKDVKVREGDYLLAALITEKGDEFEVNTFTIGDTSNEYIQYAALIECMEMYARTAKEITTSFDFIQMMERATATALKSLSKKGDN